MARPPRSLRRAAGLVLLQAAALLVLGVAYAVSGVLGSPENRVATVLAGLLAAVVGLALVAVGRGLGRGRAWALSPSVVTQVFVVVVAVGLLQGGVLLVAVPLLVLAAAVLWSLATSGSRAVFRDAG